MFPGLVVLGMDVMGSISLLINRFCSLLSCDPFLGMNGLNWHALNRPLMAVPLS